MSFISTNFAFTFCQVGTRAALPVAEVSGPEQTGLTPYYPVEVPYEKFFEWVWRVRKWRTVASLYVDLTDDDGFAVTTRTGTVTIDQTVGPPAIAAWNIASPYSPGTIVTYGGAWYYAIGSLPGGEQPDISPDDWRLLAASSDVDAEEQSLVCDTERPLDAPLDYQTDVGVITETTPPAPPTVEDAQVAMAWVFGFYSAPIWKRNGTMWLPQLAIRLSIVTNGAPLHDVDLTSMFSEDPDPGGRYTYGYVNMTFDGHTISLQYVASDTGSGINETTALSSVSIVVSPEEWYGFDPGDGGGPIWNSATGAQLRSPFSIQP